jgi:hypothetical protein
MLSAGPVTAARTRTHDQSIGRVLLLLVTGKPSKEIRAALSGPTRHRNDTTSGSQRSPVNQNSDKKRAVQID